MIEEKMDEMIKHLKEISTWIKVSEFNNVRELLLSTLIDDKAKLIYHLSDGVATRTIEKKLSTYYAKKYHVSHATIHNKYWKSWSEIGIVEPISAKGGYIYKRIFSLVDFGVVILPPGANSIL